MQHPCVHSQAARALALQNGEVGNAAGGRDITQFFAVTASLDINSPNFSPLLAQLMCGVLSAWVADGETVLNKDIDGARRRFRQNGAAAAVGQHQNFEQPPPYRTTSSWRYTRHGGSTLTPRGGSTSLSSLLTGRETHSARAGGPRTYT